MIQPESIVLAFAGMENNFLRYQNSELQKIRNVLKNAEQARHIHVIEHSGATYASLAALFNSSKGASITMLHFSGHSSLEGLIVQSETQSGMIGAAPLVQLLKAHKKMRFVFLNSCYSNDIAQQLVNAGVPYVIGTVTEVQDHEAAIVGSEFYNNLAGSSKTIEEAFVLTRNYIEDPMNADAKNIRDAFRTMQLRDKNKDSYNYPWRLYKDPALKEAQKNWTLVPKDTSAGIDLKVRKKLSVLALVIVVFAIVMFALYKVKRPDNGAHINNAPRADTIKPIDTMVKNKPDAGHATGKRPGIILHDSSNKPVKYITISGTIADSQTMAPLDSVIVSVDGKKAISKNGSFSLSQVAPQRKFNYPLYFSKNRLPYKNTN